MGDTSEVSKDLSFNEMNNKAYLEQITCMNSTILKIIKMLKAKKLYDNSLIIITSDHSVGAVDFILKKEKQITNVTNENLSKIQKNQKFFNETVNKRGSIPLWIKPAYHKKGLIYDDRMILSLDLPVTTLGAVNLKKDTMPGLDILDDNISDNTFNKRTKTMIMYGQYNGKFKPFTYLVEERNNWSIIEEEKAIQLEKNNFFIK
ncbi:hypothetical protein N8310_01480 [Pseudomonadota bacterium]|nr:hypothetical protein [Pseudomonadota bacterium]